MPVYEYECKTCNKVMEIQQKMSDAPLSECPECGASVKKLMSINSFQLKGGGWYADGYSSSSSSSSASSSSSSSSSSGGGEKAACSAGGGCGCCPAAQS